MRVHHWCESSPQPPELPPPGVPVLLRVEVPGERAVAGKIVRGVLRRVLAAWSGLPPERLPLVETPRGPAWSGLLHGETLGISLAYAGSHAWIALLRGGRVGVDATAVTAIPEAATVAQLYLGPDAARTIADSDNPTRAFADAWASHEARIKCLGLELDEWTLAGAQTEAACRCIIVETGTADLAVAIAMAGSGAPS